MLGYQKIHEREYLKNERSSKRNSKNVQQR